MPEYSDRRKQISIMVSIADWRAIRYEAARQKIPMTDLVRQWMTPDLIRLRQSVSQRSRELDPRENPDRPE